MRLSILCAGLAGVAALACGTGGQAQEASSTALLERFDALCVDTLADRVAMRRVAESSGWMPAPDGMFPPDETIKNPEIWIQSSREGMHFAFVADIEYGREGEILPMGGCAVGVMPAPSGFAEALDKFAGGNRLENFGTEPSERIYGFQVVDGAARPAPVMSTVSMMRALLNGELHLVAGQVEDDMGMVVYMAPEF